MLLSFDPSSSAHIGIAIFDGEELKSLFPITTYKGNITKTYRERVRPVVRGVLETHGRHRFATEIPPPTSRKDRGPRIGQAGIGYPLGVVAGLAMAAFVDGDHEVVQYHVSDWRTSMLAECAERRINPYPFPSSGPPPKTTRNPDGTVLIRWSCGHSRDRYTLADLQRSLECPTCLKGGNEVTDHWKAVAVTAARALWPALVEEMIEDCRSRTRKDRDRLPHRIEGVADAAEAGFIGLHDIREQAKERRATQDPAGKASTRRTEPREPSRS